MYQIAFDAQLLTPRPTGVERYIHYLLEALDDLGAASGVRIDAYVSRAAADPRRWGWVRARGVRGTHRSRLLRIAWEQLVLPWVAERYGLLHAPAYVAPLAARVPVVLTVHDLIALESPELCSRSNAWHYGAVMPVSIRRAAQVIAPTHWVRERVMRRFGLAADKVTTVYEGIDERFRRPPKDETVRRLIERWGLGGRVVLFVGNLEPKKNLPALLRVFDRLRDDHRDLQLVLCGRLAWRREELLRTLGEMRHRDAVVLTGYLPDPEVHALYHQAEVFVFPSLTEGFGIPPLEAMACGTPVVTSRGTAAGEVAGEAALLVDPSDEAELAEALRRFLGDERLRDEMRRKGLAHSRGFTWSRAAEETLAVYRRVLEERR